MYKEIVDMELSMEIGIPYRPSRLQQTSFDAKNQFILSKKFKPKSLFKFDFDKRKDKSLPKLLLILSSPYAGKKFPINNIGFHVPACEIAFEAIPISFDCIGTDPIFWFKFFFLFNNLMLKVHVLVGI